MYNSQKTIWPDKKTYCENSHYLNHLHEATGSTKPGTVIYFYVATVGHQQRLAKGDS